MEHKMNYKMELDSLRGKTIAIVYIFEMEDAPGFHHYAVWKSDIISGWLNAVQELECMPFILDVRTFAQKAMDRTLPHLDYVINLNCGSYRLSSMSIVPSVCSFLNIPCIPCDAVSIVASENKELSNLLAVAMNLNVPKPLETANSSGIFKPLNLGSSIGVKRGYQDDPTTIGVYQEFIRGYDITIPLVYNPYVHELDLLPPILYLPKTLDPNWIYDEEEKIRDDGFTTHPILGVEDKTKRALLDFAHVFPITTFGRIDARLRCSQEELSSSITEEPLSMDNLYFVEINSMPTIEKDDSFEYAFKAAQTCEQHSFFTCSRHYKDLVSKPTINGFLLSCSMISFARAKY